MILFLSLAMQCERGTSYKPCISTCPLETCNTLTNIKRQNLICNEEPCVEGCSPEPCMNGNIYENMDNLKVHDSFIKILFANY